MKKRYVVSVHGKDSRRTFFKYILENYKLKIDLDIIDLIDDTEYPFVVDFKDKVLWICNSICCCRGFAFNNEIITEKEFKKINERK